MEHLEGIMKLADAELESIIKNGKFRSREEIDSVGKLIDMVKDIECMNRWEDEMYGESYDDSYGHSMRNSYDGGTSYARSRRNARRDSQGRYRRESYRDSYDDGRSMSGYSRTDGKEDYKNQLRMMMEDAPSEEVRMSIKRMIDNLK